MRRRRKTEGALCLLTLQAFGACLCEAFAVVEAERQTAEAGPAALRRAAGAGDCAVRGEVAGAAGDAGDLAGAQIDQQVELHMRIGQACQHDDGVVWIVGHPGERFIVAKEREAFGEDVNKVRLQRHDRAEVPEDPEDDLRQLEHGREYRLRPAGWGLVVADPASGFRVGL